MYNHYERLLYYKKLACEADGFEYKENAMYVFTKDNPYREVFAALNRAYWRFKYEATKND
jgi:hypothetical protein